MARTTVGATYGDAIFEVAQEQHLLEQLEAELLPVVDLFQTHEDFKAFVYSPIVESAAKIDLLQKLLGGQVCEVGLHFLFVMVKRGRVQAIPEAILHFVDRSREVRGIETAVVYVARPLTEAQRNALTDTLGRDTGKTILLREELRPSIMGGIIIEIGDQRIDSSVARRLEDIERVLRSGSTTEIGVKESV